MGTPLIEPLPPVAAGVGLPWDTETLDPIGALAAARRDLGDTFVVDSGPDRYLFTFSPAGVASFYGLAEEQASKGLADWRMLRRKLPDELFSGRRTLPHQLFGRDDVVSYLACLDRALDLALADLGDGGTLDVFAFTRRLGHRMGLAAWGGPGSEIDPGFSQLAAAFDQLDGSDAFVHPDAMAAVALSGKAAEYEALSTITDVLGPAVTDRLGPETGPGDDQDLFNRMVDRWSGEPQEVATVGVAHDVVLVHVASMSNLFAALGWALVDLLDHPVRCAEVAAGDRALAERCALESTRLAQRSIMARHVLTPVDLNVGATTHRIDPGVTIATLLPLTNTTAAPGLDSWNPDRWTRRRLTNVAELPTPELVTAFGHGHHTCPAQPFSLAAMTAALIRLTGGYTFTPTWTEHPEPIRAQIGGVARAAQPCVVRYRRETR